jgi:hypothetical protein
MNSNSLFLVLAFRGTCVDDGTAFELGYAFAKAKRLIVYTPNPDLPLKDRMEKEFKSEVRARPSILDLLCLRMKFIGAVCSQDRAAWLKKEEYPRTEDFPGCKTPGPVNLMITGW